ncbi:acyltransferase [Spirosoma sp. KNUC1025]|uniref:acyltransferase family protein n=1 Tax=Spirosoma sp. KNUC1025 TaxID=2894082 RepID=UPI003866F564|nr:acyltransferase [Spirosoma sp. KNUC1025]
MPIFITTRPTELTKSSDYLPALTGIRAVAAYLVFLHHYQSATPGTFANRLFNQGYIGVSIFFVLSGFLIYHRYPDASLTHSNRWWRFLQNRFARIVPLYTILLLLTIGLKALAGRPTSVPLSVLNVTLLKGFFDTYKFSGIPQSWSLTVEVCFYLVAPLLFVSVRRYGPVWPTIVLISLGVLLWATVGQASPPGFFGTLPFVFFYTFFGRSFEFLMGMWLAQRWQQKRLPALRFATVRGLLTIIVCVLWQANVSLVTASQTLLLCSEVMAYNILLPVGIAMLFLGLLREPTLVQKGLGTRLMQLAGRTSYAFYLVHLGVIADALQKLGVRNIGYLFGLFLLIAQVLYFTIEKPFHQRFRAVA